MSDETYAARLQAFIFFMGDLGFYDDVARARKRGDIAAEAELMRFEGRVRDRWHRANRDAIRKVYARAKSKKISPYDALIQNERA